jgi:oxygen-independent coproporphyrinogen-3 oxidase
MPSLPSPPAPTVSRLDLLQKYDKPVPRYTSYPTAATFHAGVGAADLEAELARPGEAPLSLYVHVPFCRHACWFCGCHRVTTQLGSRVVEPYLAALARELDLVTAVLPRRPRLAQLHWGGGTPNYLTASEAETLWGLIHSHFTLEPDLEASIELNPELLDRDRVMALRQLGFNRMSFGLQDAHPEVQRAVNRVVPADQLRRVMHWLREADVRSVNVDLICGLPLQTPERFRTTLELVRELRPDRLSLFSFAYLPDQLPLQRKINPEDLPTPRARLTMLDEAHQWLNRHGYAAIGLDHYALEGDSLARAAREGRLHRNFQGYTTGGDLALLGLGPSAISQFPHLFTQNHSDLKAYTAALAQGVLPVARGLVVRDPDVLERRRLIRDVMCRFQTCFDRHRYPLEWEELSALAADGLLHLEDREGLARLEVSREGRWLLRSIAAVFDPGQRGAARGARLV